MFGIVLAQGYKLSSQDCVTRLTASLLTNLNYVHLSSVSDCLGRGLLQENSFYQVSTRRKYCKSAIMFVLWTVCTLCWYDVWYTQYICGTINICVLRLTYVWFTQHLYGIFSIVWYTQHLWVLLCSFAMPHVSAVYSVFKFVWHNSRCSILILISSWVFEYMENIFSTCKLVVKFCEGS